MQEVGQLGGGAIGVSQGGEGPQAVGHQPRPRSGWGGQWGQISWLATALRIITTSSSAILLLGFYIYRFNLRLLITSSL